MTARYLNASEIAAILGISRTKVYRILHGIPRVKLGTRCVRVSEEDLQKYIASKKVTAWDDSTSDTETATTTGTTPPLKEAASNEVSRPRTARSPKKDSDLPSWARRPIRAARSKG